MKWWQNSIALPRRQPATFNNRSLRAGSFRRRLFAEVTRFDIVTIEVEHERGVVIVAVLAPKPRRPIILRAPSKEAVHQFHSAARHESAAPASSFSRSKSW